MQRFPHGFKHEGSTTCTGLKQVFVGRILVFMFGRGEPGSLHEIEDGDRGIAELFTGSPGGFHIPALQFRAAGNLLLGVPAHERKIQRPPGNAQERYPDKLLLQEELEQWNAAVQHMLDRRNVGPALVVTGHKIPVLTAQVLDAADVPLDIMKDIGQHIVEADPQPGNAIENNGAPFAHRGHRNHQFYNREDHQNREQPKGIEQDKYNCKHTFERCRQKTEHRLGSPESESGNYRWQD